MAHWLAPIVLNSLCLNGRNATLFVSEQWNRSQDTVIFFQGGLWCYSPSDSLEAADWCIEKSTHNTGWSRWKFGFNGTDSAYSGYLQPLAAGRNFVYVPHCDLTSFSGTAGMQQLVFNDNETRTIHYDGFNILKDVIQEVRSRIQPLNGEKRPRVILSGSNSGACAVYYHANFVKEQLPNATVVALPDSGFYLELSAVNGTNVWPAQMVRMQEAAKSRLDQRCEASMEKSKCLFAPHFAHLIETPIFLLQSFYEWSTVRWTLYVSKQCQIALKSGTAFDKCTPLEMSNVILLYGLHLRDMSRILFRQSTMIGAFLTNAFSMFTFGLNHTIRNTTWSEAFDQWLEKPWSRNLWIDSSRDIMQWDLV